MNPDPNAPPQQSKGTATRKSVMGGHYFEMDVSGKMQMPDEDGKMKDVQFKGSGIRARATLLRMHELAQIQIPVVTDRCRTP